MEVPGSFRISHIIQSKVKGTAMQNEKVLINDPLRVSKVS